jgi:hypothetical protein
LHFHGNPQQVHHFFFTCLPACADALPFFCHGIAGAEHSPESPHISHPTTLTNIYSVWKVAQVSWNTWIPSWRRRRRDFLCYLVSCQLIVAWCECWALRFSVMRLFNPIDGFGGCYSLEPPRHQPLRSGSFYTSGVLRPTSLERGLTLAARKVTCVG